MELQEDKMEIFRRIAEDYSLMPGKINQRHWTNGIIRVMIYRQTVSIKVGSKRVSAVNSTDEEFETKLIRAFDHAMKLSEIRFDNSFFFTTLFRHHIQQRFPGAIRSHIQTGFDDNVPRLRFGLTENFDIWFPSYADADERDSGRTDFSCNIGSFENLIKQCPNLNVKDAFDFLQTMYDWMSSGVVVAEDKMSVSFLDSSAVRMLWPLLHCGVERFEKTEHEVCLAGDAVAIELIGNPSEKVSVITAHLKNPWQEIAKRSHMIQDDLRQMLAFQVLEKSDDEVHD